MMTDTTYHQFIDLVITMAPKEEKVTLAFGCGETFTAFDRWIEGIDRLFHDSEKEGKSFSVEVSTNGLLLDASRLAELARRNIALTFSIDGPIDYNDKNRVSGEGVGSHARSLANYRLYRDIIGTMEHPPSLNAQSVLVDGGGLLKVRQFWIDQGTPIFLDILAEPSQFISGDNGVNWAKRRKGYLAAYESLAFEMAEELTIPHFLADFKGPYSLYDFWTSIFLGKDPGVCGAALNTVAIDADGALFPCEKFIGEDRWQVGDISNGLEEKKMEEFRQTVDDLTAPCAACDATLACEGGCIAAMPKEGLTLNHDGGCSFAAEVTSIARSAFAKMRHE